MPRKARIDALGALHHIIVRGIERRKIFNDDVDRIIFLDRLGKVLSETDAKCFSWALIPNHFHLLLRTGACPLSTVMRHGSLSRIAGLPPDLPSRKRPPLKVRDLRLAFG